MKVVLRQGSNYFVKMTQDKFDLDMAETSQVLQDAQVFEMYIVDQKLVISPPIPAGSWELLAVSLHTN